MDSPVTFGGFIRVFVTNPCILYRPTCLGNVSCMRHSSGDVNNYKSWLNSFGSLNSKQTQMFNLLQYIYISKNDEAGLFNLLQVSMSRSEKKKVFIPRCQLSK